MSVYNLWDKSVPEPKLKQSTSSEWNFVSPIASPRPSSPPLKRDEEAIFNKYSDLIRSKSNVSVNAKKTDSPERPFDFFDDEEFAFGINLLNNNVACVGHNKTKLIQMAQEPWPDNVKLFQPYEVEQILLPDNASCLAVQAFLKMCNLPFEIEMRWNAEFMSPSGRVPFIKCGAFVVSELEPIAQFVANKGVSLCSRLTTEEKAEMRAYMSLITNVLVNAELYVSWLDEDTFNSVTKVRNSSVYPWPLGWLQTRSKRSLVAKRLKALHWRDKTMDQVMSDVEQCCNSLSQRLGDKDFFFGSLTPLDALLYGHVRALLSCKGPKAPVFIKPITTVLLRHAIRVANLTEMKFSPQEDYLISQAHNLFLRRRLSPDRISQRRLRKSKVSVKAGGDDIYDNTSMKEYNYGFKPFASKQVIMTTSREGDVQCQYGDTGSTIRYRFVSLIVNEIIEKVEELVQYDEESYRSDDDTVKNFEVLEQETDKEATEFVDSIEGELSDSTLSLSANEDVIQVINDTDDERVYECSSECAEDLSDTKIELPALLSDRDLLKSTIANCRMSSISCAEAQGDKMSESIKAAYYDLSTKSSGSKMTLRQMKNKQISVEKLIKCLRQRNASYNVNNVKKAEENPTELDALVFGHVFTIITTRLPCRKLADIVRKHESLVSLAKRIDEKFFKRP